MLSIGCCNRPVVPLSVGFTDSDCKSPGTGSHAAVRPVSEWYGGAGEEGRQEKREVGDALGARLLCYPVGRAGDLLGGDALGVESGDDELPCGFGVRDVVAVPEVLEALVVVLCKSSLNLWLPAHTGLCGRGIHRYTGGMAAGY